MKYLRPAVILLIMSMVVLSACGSPATQAAPAVTEQAPAATQAVTSTTPTAPTPTAASAPAHTLIYAITSEPDTLDWQKTPLAVSYNINFYLSGALAILNDQGTPTPYLAESWTISPDSLTYEFNLRQDVKFSDGTPFTAQDYAWSFNRAIDPATASPVTGPILGVVKSIEAVDDYTLRITLNEPNAPILFNLSDPGYMGPLLQSAVEAGGDNYGRNPVGVGPFKFKEWVTGDHITLERNPDYIWGPAIYNNQGPVNVDAIEFRIIPEYATIVAGLESGDITFANILPRDLASFNSSPNYQVFESLQKGLWPYLSMNVSKAPFDDVRVRQAFNLAIDREAMLTTTTQGNAVPLYGPLSSNQIGYWNGVEQIGYGFDLARAKQLMMDAGYTYDANDMLLTPDGQPFALTLYTTPIDESWIKVAEIAQSQYKQLGVDITLSQLDPGVLIGQVISGDYNITVFGVTALEADVLWSMFHSSQAGAFNTAFTNDPDLDALLAQTRTTTDPAARQEVIDQVQKMIVEKAYIVPVYSSKIFYVINSQVTGATWTIYDILNLADVSFQ
jgi:peptide/nickel transport system substrate-binding protein